MWLQSQGGGECIYIAKSVSCDTQEHTVSHITTATLTISSLCTVLQHGTVCSSLHGTQCPWVVSATIVFLVTVRAHVRAAAFTTGVWNCVALSNRLETSSRSTVLSFTGILPWARPLWKEKTTESGWPQGVTWLQPQTVTHALHTCKPGQLPLKRCLHMNNDSKPVSALTMHVCQSACPSHTHPQSGGEHSSIQDCSTYVDGIMHIY